MALDEMLRTRNQTKGNARGGPSTKKTARLRPYVYDKATLMGWQKLNGTMERVPHQTNKCQKTSWLGSLACPARLTQARRAIHLWVQPVRARTGYGWWFNHPSKHSPNRTSSACLSRKEKKYEVEPFPVTVAVNEIGTITTECKGKESSLIHHFRVLGSPSRALGFSLAPHAAFLVLLAFSSGGREQMRLFFFNSYKIHRPNSVPHGSLPAVVRQMEGSPCSIKRPGASYRHTFIINSLRSQQLY